MANKPAVKIIVTGAIQVKSGTPGVVIVKK